MLRSGRNGPLARSVRSLTQRNRCSSFAVEIPLRTTILHTQSYQRHSGIKLALQKPFSISVRYASSIKPVDKINHKKEKESGSVVMEAHPETVSLDSSVRQVFKEKDKEEPEDEEAMLAGVYSDWVSLPTTVHYISQPLTADISSFRKPSRRL